MGKCYIINAPYLFTAMWNGIKGWLNEVTAAKIEVLGRDYMETLSERIPLHNIPKHLGGTCECAGGCTMSDKGPWNEDYVPSPMEEAQEPEDPQGIQESSFSSSDWVMNPLDSSFPRENIPNHKMDTIMVAY